MDAVISALGWLVDHKVVSAPIAGAVIVGLVIGYLLNRRKAEPEPQIDASHGGKVQQTELRGVSAEGDVTVRSDQR